MSQLIADGIDIVVYQAKVDQSFAITEVALVEDVIHTQGNTNFVTIELDLEHGSLAAPIPHNARLLQRYPGLKRLMSSPTIAELA